MNNKNNEQINEDAEIEAALQLDKVIAETNQANGEKDDLLDLGDCGGKHSFSKYLGMNLNDIDKHVLLATKDFNTIFNNFDLKYGCFGVVLNQPINLHLGSGVVKSVLNSALSNFNVLGLQKDIVVVEPSKRCFVGCNRAFLLEDGSLNTQGIIDEITHNAADKFFYPKEISEYMYETSPYDSHVYYIYNMLTTWLYAVIHERTPNKKYSYVNGSCMMHVVFNKPYYEDDHCVIEYGPKTHLEKLEVVVPFGYYDPDPDTHSVHFDERDKINYFNKPYTLRLPNDAKGYKLTFYLSHVFEREPYYEWVNFDIGFHPLVRDLLVDFVGVFKGKGKGRLSRLIPIQEPIPSEVLLQWIQDYVRANHLLYDYSCALELLFRAAFWPIPETQEGNVWTQMGKLQIAMPDFYPLRGTFPPLFTGDQYVPPGIITYRLRDQKSIFNYLCLCAIENYVLIYGLQLQIYVRVHFSKSWYAACRAENDEFSLFGVWNAYERCFKILFDCMFLTNMSKNCYVSFVFKFKEFKGVKRVRNKPRGQAVMDELNKRRRRLYLDEKDDFYGRRHKLVAEVLREPISIIEFKNLITDENGIKILSQSYDGIDTVYSKDKLTIEVLENLYNKYVKYFAKNESSDWFFVSILPAWVTGGLIDGCIGIDSVYSAVLKPSWSFEPNIYARWNTQPFDRCKALWLTQTARYFNRDIQWFDRQLMDHKKHPIVPWANVRQRIIEPSFLLFNCLADVIYYGGDITNWLRKDLDIERDIWSMVQDGFSLQKTRGTYYQSEYMSRVEVTYVVKDLRPINPHEEKYIITFEVADGRSRPRDYIEDKEVEETGVVNHFRRLEVSNRDPSEMLPGVVRQ